MDLDQSYFTRSVGRIYRLMAVFAAAGVVVLLPWRGWSWSLGFALGAAASWLNFHWLRKLVNSLGQAAAGKPPRKRTAVMLGLRYLLLGAGGYAILNYSDLSLAAALAGLFVSAAAVIVEIVYQLIIYGSS